MEVNTNRLQVPDASSSFQPRNSTFRLSPAAVPFTPVPPSKAHAFNHPSSCVEPDGLLLGDYAAQTSHLHDYGPEGLEEWLDPSNYGINVSGSEFSGSNRLNKHSAGSLYFGPADRGSATEKEKNNSTSPADRSSGKEGGNGILKGSKSLDGTHESVCKISTRISERGTKAAENLSLVNLARPISPIRVSRSPVVFSTSLSGNSSLNEKPNDPDGTADGSFIHVDKNDLSTKEPDEDSPCWRGTVDSIKSPLTPSRCASSKISENTSEACRTLNPLAPQFIPQSVERRLNSNGSRPSDSNETGELGEDYLGRNTDSLFMLGPRAIPLAEEIISLGNIITGNGMASMVPRSDIEDISVNEALFCIPEYPCAFPSLDAEQLVNTMHDLSKILRTQHPVNYLLSDPLRKKIQGIIQNLSVYLGESGPGIGDSLPTNSSADPLKIPNIGIHPPDEGKVSNAPRMLETQSTTRTQATCSSLPMTRVWDSSTFIGNISAEIAQAGTDALVVVGLKMDQQMAPQTLLYKNLWLQATEELHSMKNRSEECET